MCDHRPLPIYKAMHELEFKTLDKHMGKIVESPHFPSIFVSDKGDFGFRKDERYKILQYVGRKDIHGKKIYTHNIIQQACPTDFGSSVKRIVEVFFCENELAFEARDPFGKETEHWSIELEVELIALNYQDYLTKK